MPTNCPQSHPDDRLLSAVAGLDRWLDEPRDRRVPARERLARSLDSGLYRTLLASLAPAGGATA